MGATLARDTLTVETQVLIALIASGSALLVAAGTGLATVLQARSQRRHDIAATHDDKRLELAIEQWRERHAAATECLKALQDFQDQITLLVRTAPNSPSSGWRKRLINARDRVIAAYRDHHMTLTPDERDRLQIAKEKVIETVLFLDMAGVWIDKRLDLDSSGVVQVERILPLLNQAQQDLLLSMFGRIDLVLGTQLRGDHE